MVKEGQQQQGRLVQEEEIWSDDKKRRHWEDYDKAFEPYEKMGFEPWDDTQWKLFGILMLALIPSFCGIIVNIYLS